jgi:hypothetical protein
LESRKAKAGDNLVFDFYPTGMTKTPNFAMIADGVLPIGQMYPCKLKSDLRFHVQGHFSNFVLPCTLTGDFSKELHLGKNQFLCRGKAVQLRSSTPHHQWQHAGERHMFRVINMTTYVMLDAQFPEALTMHAAQHAALILMVSPVTHEGLVTTACKVYFQVDFNYTMLKRQGCMVYYRLEKKERKKFGTQGSLAVLIGLNGFKFPDFTYKLYLPSNKQIIFRRDVLFAEDYLPYRHGREMLGAKFDHWVLPEIGELSRSHLRESVRVDLTLDGWDDGSLAVAATNLSADPSTWMDLSGGANSPVRVNDAVVVDFEDCTVLNVSQAGVRVHSPGNGNVLLPPSSTFFVDSGNLMGRPVRKKHAREFFHFSPEATKKKRAMDPLGLEFIGMTFSSTPPKDGVLPDVYTILRTGDPRKFMKPGSKKPMPILEYKKSSEVNDPTAETHESSVNEIRNWIKSTKKHLDAAAAGEDLGTAGAEAVLSPLLVMEPVKLKLARAMPKTNRERMRELIGKASMARKVKRFKRLDIIDILKNGLEFKRKKLFKFGIDVAADWADAHGTHRSKEYSEKWRVEEVEEMNTLDKYFRKKLHINDLKKEFPDLKPLTGMWVYDAHPVGVKSTTHRARFVANGARDPDKGQNETYSPVAQLANVRVVLAMIKELQMELVVADVSKAYWKGRYNRGSVYMWAAKGFSSFEGECWEVLAPINGLDDSGHTWYQSIAEIMRMIGFKHHHPDPCFFRRLRGPGITCSYPDHTDCPKWRREAPNEDYNPHHVEMINPKATNALPYPNVLQTGDPAKCAGEVLHPMTQEEVNEFKLSTAAAEAMWEQLRTCKPGQEKAHYYEIALWYVDDLLMGTYDPTSILADLERRFGKLTTHINGGMFLGHDIEYDKVKDVIILRLKTYLERVMESILEKRKRA